MFRWLVEWIWFDADRKLPWFFSSCIFYRSWICWQRRSAWWHRKKETSIEVYNCVNLRWYIRPYTEEELWNVFMQIVEGVRYLHSLGVIHRDLKPLNIFMFNDGTVKVIRWLLISRSECVAWRFWYWSWIITIITVRCYTRWFTTVYEPWSMWRTSLWYCNGYVVFRSHSVSIHILSLFCYELHCWKIWNGVFVPSLACFRDCRSCSSNLWLDSYSCSKDLFQNSGGFSRMW